MNSCARAGLSLLIGLLSMSAAHSQSIFVVNQGSGLPDDASGSVGEYTLSGGVVNASLITGLYAPSAIDAAGSSLYVSSFIPQPLPGGGYTGSYAVGEYTTSGHAVNAELVSGLLDPDGIAVSGTDLYAAYSDGGTPSHVGKYSTSASTRVENFIPALGYLNASDVAASGSNVFIVNFMAGTVGEYTSSGTAVNASLISGLNGPDAIAVSGSNLYVLDEYGTVGKYSTDGAVVDASLIAGASLPSGYNDIAVYGSNLFLLNGASGTISEYTTSGALVNASLVTGLNNPSRMAVAAVPEPATFQLGIAGMGLIGLMMRRRVTR